MSHTRVDVAGTAAYTIHIGTALLHDATLLAQHWRGNEALIVSDSHVAALYADALRARLESVRPGARIGLHTFPAGEGSKTLEHFAHCLDALARLKARRDACVFALGGGVTGDLAGFAAACWMRGIDCIQLPTSLLAMVDSSVGGKTAVDIPAGKNLVGAFHLPRAVIIDTATLATLPARELRAGLAEVVKYAAIYCAGFFAWLEHHSARLLALEADAIAQAIARSCQFKADVVARDPYEQGERALLNFGHTFAHAIEAEQGFGGLVHGEAVAVGMVLAAALSSRLGLAPEADGTCLRQLLLAFGLPVGLPPGLDAAALVARMRLDKKATADGLRFVLWQGIGRAQLVAGVDEADVHAVLAAAQPGAN